MRIQGKGLVSYTFKGLLSFYHFMYMNHIKGKIAAAGSVINSAACLKEKEFKM